MILGIIITILVFSSDAAFYGKFHLIFEAYVGLGGFYYTFGVLLVAAIRKREGAFISFIGMFMLYATAINDVMNSMGIINTNDLATYGIAIFMFLQSYLLTRKSAIALKENNKLSEALKLEKLNLEERIEERTQTLTQQSEELKKYQEEQEKQNWVNEGLNLITDVMRQNKEDYEALADQLLATLVKQVGAAMGAMYLLTKVYSEDKLQLSANYGLNKDARIDIIDVNEGLTGKCFSTGKENYIEEIPERYFSISSGLGSSTPKILALIPMRIDEFIIGVVEIASFKPITDIHKAFLIRAIENISAQLNIVKMNKESQEMIAEYKQLEQEAKAKNQEMLENLEELKAIQEEAEKREKELNHILDNARKTKEDLKKKLQKSIDKQTELKKRLVEVYKDIENLKNSKRKK
jgi:F0F1-type ATP synthase membrane subunit b/b'